jgi:hypothetical protein
MNRQLTGMDRICRIKKEYRPTGVVAVYPVYPVYPCEIE